MLVASGVIGVTRDGDNGPEAQFRRAFERMIEILEENELTIRDVAEMTTYHVDLGKLGRDFIRVKDEYLPETPYPAWTAIGVDRLFLDSALIEIRFIAALPPGE
ncbi:MAG: RidA family protein [Gemmatimonadetes bacterium]|nr:RidA family protein [Gemmatimonadota bacterium]NIR79065.1 RidA family protein [Gemmatimonadota bacterium]NIW37053.1 RidA family protein [Gemmatimonadota bacterium]NIW64664.1 RidA family protein [Gemmatimonadota bacterium]